MKLVGALEQFQAKFVPPTPAPGTSGSDDDDDEGALKSDELNLNFEEHSGVRIKGLLSGNPETSTPHSLPTFTVPPYQLRVL